MNIKRITTFSIFILSYIIFSTVPAAAEIENGDEEYLAFAEEMPSPVGGMSEIIKNIKYPMIAQKNKIEGTVYLQVFIDESGNPNKVIVLKDIGGGCGEAASEAVQKVKFTPAKMKGAAVKVKLSLPITFKLQG